LPIRAIIDGSDVHAYEYSDEAWSEFKTLYKTLSPLMPCCETPAIPKTSKLGNFFFAHQKKGRCLSEPESAEHIFLKSLIARAAINAGWSVIAECHGTSAFDEKWVADVLCKKGKVSVALEVQLSPITYSDLLARTERYRRSNVRVAWFADALKFRDWKSKSNKSLPLFGISQLASGETPLVEHFGISIVFSTSMISVGSVINQSDRYMAAPLTYMESQLKLFRMHRMYYLNFLKLLLMKS
jgi:competence CoiA-like predicted nuclease